MVLVVATCENVGTENAADTTSAQLVRIIKNCRQALFMLPPTKRMQSIRFQSSSPTTHERPNGGVDAAARIKAPFAAPRKLRNTLPPLQRFVVRRRKGIVTQ